MRSVMPRCLIKYCCEDFPRSEKHLFHQQSLKIQDVPKLENIFHRHFKYVLLTTEFFECPHLHLFSLNNNMFFVSLIFRSFSMTYLNLNVFQMFLFKDNLYVFPIKLVTRVVCWVAEIILWQGTGNMWSQLWESVRSVVTWPHVSSSVPIPVPVYWLGGGTCLDVNVSMLLLGLGQCIKLHFNRSTGAPLLHSSWR